MTSYEPTTEDFEPDLTVESIDFPREAVMNLLKKILSEREYDILNCRHGLEHNQSETLYAIAQRYGVTRERIRQIEQQAIKLCLEPAYQNVFKQFLEASRNSILSTLFDRTFFMSRDNATIRFRAVGGMEKFSLKILFDKVENWLDTNLESISSATGTAGWLIPGVEPEKRKRIEQWVAEGSEQKGNLRQRIKRSVRSAPWPITIAHLCRQIPDHSRAELVKCLREEFGAKIENNVIKHIDKLPSSTRLILVLREAQQALHLSSVRAAHKRLFERDLSEHAAGAVLQRLEEALIVERGTYDLYENLIFDPMTVQKIRDLAATQLDEIGHFLSAKLLRRKMLDSLSPEIAHHLTPYMVHGICQDDSRFATHRGLMIGLSRKSFEQTFSSLTNTIHNIVRDSGPVSLAEVKGKMSHERSVLDVNIHIVLKNSNEIIATGNGTYDLINRVIGDDEAIERLSYSIEIALIDKSVSFHVLVARLAAIGCTLSNPTILSFLRNLQDIEKINDLFSLKRASSEVEDYNSIFHDLYDPHKNATQNRDALQHALSGNTLQTLIDSDFRLVMEALAWNTTSPQTDNGTDLLDKMMAEFNF